MLQKLRLEAAQKVDLGSKRLFLRTKPLQKASIWRLAGWVVGEGNLAGISRKVFGAARNRRESSGGMDQQSPRQTKPKKGQFMNFSQAHSGTKIRCESCLFPIGKNTRIHQKWAKFMNFSFGPFLWFGLPGRLLNGMAGGMELRFISGSEFQFSEPEFWQNRSDCGISEIFRQISAPEAYFSDSGKSPFHMPPIHTLTNFGACKKIGPQNQAALHGVPPTEHACAHACVNGYVFVHVCACKGGFRCRASGLPSFYHPNTNDGRRV